MNKISVKNINASSELEVIMACSSDAVFIMEIENYKILEANNNAALLLGYFKEALTEYHFLDFLDFQSKEDWFIHVNSLAQEEEVENFSGRINLSSSNSSIIEAKTRFIQYQERTVLISFVKEVTGFPHQINQLKKKIDFYKFIFNEMPTEFAVLSPQWRYMFVNKNSIKDDKVREWIIGKSDYDYCELRNKDSELARNRQANYQAVADSKEVKEWVEEMKNKKGETIYILRKLYPYFVDEQLHLTFGFGLDITKIIKGEHERKKMLDVMAQKNEELRQFAYIITHDLKEPLRGISSFSHLLKRRYSDKLDGEALEFFSFIMDSVDRMNGLLSDLTEFVTIDKNQEDTKLVNLEDVVFLAQANLSVLINEKQAKITTKNLPEVMGHRVYLNQLILNLINNALKFCKNRLPEIHIEATQKDGFYIIEVKDNGIGISKEYQKKIFKLFNRLNKQEFAGTGMGLAICKKIVRMHDGEIWVKSDGETGSSFFFSLKIDD